MVFNLKEMDIEKYSEELKRRRRVHGSQLTLYYYYWHALPVAGAALDLSSSHLNAITCKLDPLRCQSRKVIIGN